MPLHRTLSEVLGSVNRDTVVSHNSSSLALVQTSPEPGFSINATRAVRVTHRRPLTFFSRKSLQHLDLHVQFLFLLALFRQLCVRVEKRECGGACYLGSRVSHRVGLLRHAEPFKRRVLRDLEHWSG